MITIENLLEQIASGEDSTRQFKADVRNAESLASENGGLCQFRMDNWDRINFY